VPPLSVRWAAVIASVAALLAFFAIFRVDLAGSPVISFRFHDRWQSQEALALTGTGFPTSGGGRTGSSLSPLANLFANYAASQEVRQFILRDGPLHGSYRVFAGTGDAQPLPILTFEGTARTKAIAAAIAARVSRDFRAYILQKQEEMQISKTQRIQFPVVSPAAKNVKQVQGRRLLWPLVVLSVVFALLALALVSARRSRT
jgi:hypothetical protein